MGDVVPREPSAGAPDGYRSRARLRRFKRHARRGARRGGSDGAPSRGRGGAGAETLGREDVESAAVIGAGVNGRAAARTFLARGRPVSFWDVDTARAEAAASELGADVAATREEALAADLVATVTPGHGVVYQSGSLRI